jgi:hypothetical protein
VTQSDTPNPRKPQPEKDAAREARVQRILREVKMTLRDALPDQNKEIRFRDRNSLSE